MDERSTPPPPRPRPAAGVSAGSATCSTIAASASPPASPWSWRFRWPCSSTSSSSRSTTWRAPRPWCSANSVRKRPTPPPTTWKTRSSGRTSACCSACRRPAPMRSTAPGWTRSSARARAEPLRRGVLRVVGGVAATGEHHARLQPRQPGRGLRRPRPPLPRRPRRWRRHPAAAAAAARTQARHRGLPGHHRRTPQGTCRCSCASPVPTATPSRASSRSWSMPRRSAPCTCRR